MTVSSIVVRAVAVWSGAETEFPTGVQILDRAQLVVSLVPDEGARQVLTLGLHYSIILSPAGTATVVPLGAFPATPGTVSFVRQTPMTQTYDPTATDTYDAAGHAAALDRSAMRIAELSEKVDDIEAASIVVIGGAASVPVGAVYVSNGEGGAVAGPTAAEIETARAAAVSAAGTATGAAGVATGAATVAGNAATLADQLANAAPNTPVGMGFSARHWAAVAQALSDAFDLDAYSTTEQIATMLEAFVPTTRKLKVGAGLSLDGDAGSDEQPAEGNLSADRLIKLLFAPGATVIAGEDDERPVNSAGVHAAIVAALGGLNLGGAAPKATLQFNASTNYTPTPGTKFILIALTGAGGGGNGSSGNGGVGGPGGTGFAFVAVDDKQTYPLVVGAGGGRSTSTGSAGTGGSSTITIASVVYGATGGTGGRYNGGYIAGNAGAPMDTCLFGFWGTVSLAVLGSYHGAGGAIYTAGSSGFVSILEFRL